MKRLISICFVLFFACATAAAQDSFHALASIAFPNGPTYWGMVKGQCVSMPWGARWWTLTIDTSVDANWIPVPEYEPAEKTSVSYSVIESALLVIPLGWGFLKFDPRAIENEEFDYFMRFLRGVDDKPHGTRPMYVGKFRTGQRQITLHMID